MTSPVAGLTPDMWTYWFIGFATRYSFDEAVRRADKMVPPIGTVLSKLQDEEHRLSSMLMPSRPAYRPLVHPR